MESEESVRQCSVVAGPAAAPVTQCRSRVVEAPREVCADTEVTEARELCQEVTRMEEKITCDTHMKQIEIKVNKNLPNIILLLPNNDIPGVVCGHLCPAAPGGVQQPGEEEVQVSCDWRSPGHVTPCSPLIGAGTSRGRRRSSGAAPPSRRCAAPSWRPGARRSAGRAARSVQP